MCHDDALYKFTFYLLFYLLAEQKWLWLSFDWCDFHFSHFLFNMEDWKTLLTEIVFYNDIFCSARSLVSF